MAERRAADGGFTLIELLVAMGAFVFAVAGLLALLAAATRANASALDGTNATALAERFLEGFRARQLGWQAGSDPSVTAPELMVAADRWHLPLASSGSPWSNGRPHDAEGRPAGAVNARKAIFCVHYRLNWAPGTTAADASDVTVLARVAYTADSSESWTGCAPDDVAAHLADGGTARAVILPGVIQRQVPLR